MSSPSFPPTFFTASSTSRTSMPSRQNLCLLFPHSHLIVTPYFRFQLQKKVQFVSTVCKYWSLKRQSRRGAPLLRRLHIQSHSTQSTSISELTVDQLKAKRERLWELRDNLEKARNIVDQLSKRETLKVGVLLLSHSRN